MRSCKLFIGITSWQSALFLGHCIDAIIQNTEPACTKIVVLDNGSTDNSRKIASEKGATVINRRCTQADALNYLFNLSKSEYSLLIHADVILLSKKWFNVCKVHLAGNKVMISPEDIGCGPYTRPWGKSMPESSFMFVRTEPFRRARKWFQRRRFKVMWPYKAIDFYGEHVTYNLPRMLEERRLAWTMMRVHTSTLERNPLFTPKFKPKYWDDCWGHYRYGLGNFYSMDGQITHYHNWFDRIAAISMSLPYDSEATYPKEGGLPLAYVKAYTSRFLDDLEKRRLVLPEISGNNRL